MKFLKIDRIGIHLLLLSILLFSFSGLRGQVTIMPLGNSITWGKFSGELPAGTHGYRDRLYNKLIAQNVSINFVGPQPANPKYIVKYHDQPYEGYFRDAARIGHFLPDSTYDIQVMLDNMHPDSIPEMVILHLGTNDMVLSTEIGDYSTPGTIVHRLYRLMNILLDYSEIKHILLCTIIPKAEDEGQGIAYPEINQRISTYNSKIRAMINDHANWTLPADNPRVKLVDTYTLFLANMDTYFSVDIDPTHPNSTGYQALAEEILFPVVYSFIVPGMIDNFDRAAGGLHGSNRWRATSTIRLSGTSGQTYDEVIYCNSATGTAWDNLAVWPLSENAATVEMTFHDDATNFNLFGMAIGLNDTTPGDADGYLLWITGGTLRLWTINNGQAENSIHSITGVQQYGPGDRFKVNFRHDKSGSNSFDIMINGSPVTTIRDVAGTYYSEPFYSGVLFRDASGSPPGNAAMVTKFNALFGGDAIKPGTILGFDDIEINYNSVTLRWEATGDDGYEGTASRYDMRASPISLTSDDDIENAPVVTGLPTPLQSGSPETFVVTNLSSGQKYYFYIRAIDDWGNAGVWSKEVEVVLPEREMRWDCFDDMTMWNYDANDYKLDDRPGLIGEFTNGRSNKNWPGSVAVYKGAYNPSTIQLVWGNEVTFGNPPEIDNGGIACMLNSDQSNADGYVIFIRTVYQSIYLWTLSNGSADKFVASVPYIIKDNSGNPKYPSKDDTLKVVVDWSNELVNRFDVFVNSEQAGEGSLYDTEKEHTASGRTYAGLYLSGLYGITGRNNNVKCFGTLSSIDAGREFTLLCPAVNEAQVKTELPDPVRAQVTDGNKNPVSHWPVYFYLTEDKTGGSISAPPAVQNHIRMEAEWGKIVQQASTILAPQHLSASRGKYVEFVSGTAQSGYVEFNFYVPEAGDYYFWTRAVAEAWYSSILWVQLDGAPSNLNNGLYWVLDENFSSDPYDFKWDRIRLKKGQPFHRELNSGMHKLKIYKGHNGVKLDKILLTQNSTYYPVGVDTVETLFTNIDGIASTSWTLGEKVGANVITARAFGVTEEKTCTAFGTASAPKYITALDPSEQSGAARDTLAEPFAVVVTDQYGNVAPNVTVNWNVTEGDGVFEASGLQTYAAMTDANGKSTAKFVLGIMDSVNIVTATFTGFTGSPFQFKGHVTSGLIQKIQVIPPIKQKHYVEDVLPNHVKVKIFDDKNHPVKDVPVFFEITQGDASTGTQPKMTAADGTAQDTLWYGKTSSVVKVQVRVSSLTQEIFMDSVYYKAKKIRLYTGQNGIAPVGDTLKARMKVQVLDQYNRPLKEHPVWFRTRTPRDDHDWKFPGNKDSVEAVTNTNGVASANICAPLLHGTYPDLVEVVATDGFDPLTGSPVKFTLGAESKASRLEKFSKDSTEGVVGEPLLDLIVIRLLDGQGKPVGFQPVTFTIEDGNGHFAGMSYLDPDTVAMTNSEGYAGVKLYLGPEPGELNNIVKVTCFNGRVWCLPQNGLFYRFSAKSSNADTLIRVSSEHVSGRVGEPMNKKVQVKVGDAGGWGVDGASVTFSVLSGGGFLDGSDDTTKVVISQSAEGIASVQWTLGTKTGTDNNVLEAKAFNGLVPLNGSPILYYASGLAGDVDPDTSKIETSGSTIASGKDTCWITVTLRDQYANPVSGKEIKIKVTGGINYYDTQIGPTNTQGQATGHLISPNSGEKIIEATVLGDNIKLSENTAVNFDPNNASKIQPIYTPTQIGNVGTICRDSLAVKVTDVMGNSVANKRVYFEVVGEKGGYLIKTEDISDVDGIAATYLIFGQETGEYIVRAVANDPYGNPLDGSPAYFSLSAKEGVPVSIFAVSGDKQEGPAGSILPDPLVVGVHDVNGQPVAGVHVQFAVESGDGQIVTLLPVKTDIYGYANAYIRAGTKMNTTCWVKASGANNLALSGAPVRFSAKSVSGIGSQLMKISGDEQTGKVGETLPNPITVQVTDAYGNAVSNKPVVFTVVQGEANFGGETSVTVISNASGLATQALTLGYTTGNVRVQVSGTLLDGSPLTFSEEVTTAQADVMIPVSDLTLAASINNYLPSSIKVQVQDKYGNGVPDVSVYFTRDEGEGQLVDAATLSDFGDQIATSNENGIAEIQYMAGSSTGVCRIRAISGVHTLQFVITIRMNASLPVLNKAIISNVYSVQENDQLNPLNVLLSATDADGDVLHFEVEHIGAPDLPETMLLLSESALTARVRWVPRLDDAGTYQFIARVVDSNGGHDDKQFNVAVLNAAQAPEIIDHVPVAMDTELVAGQEHRFWIDVRDPDYDALTYSWKLDGLPIGDNSSLLVWFIPQNLAEHVCTITASASDGLLNTNHSWNVEVLPPTIVEVTDFFAEFDTRKGWVKIFWSASQEPKDTGYEIYRSTRENGQYIRLNRDPILPNAEKKYQFEDQNVKAGAQYFYKLVDVNQDEKMNEHGPILIQIPKPDAFVLDQNYPNPFNPITTIRYEVPGRDHVKILIFNIRGQVVITLVDQEMEPGYYQEKWDGRDSMGHEVSTGLYLYRLQSQNKTITKRMVKMK
ncbi:Ig-like domain-containing protein [bacterium]|nr:Ig-like domain-containing protein [bacterium]